MCLGQTDLLASNVLRIKSQPIKSHLGHVHVVVDSNEMKLYAKQYRDYITWAAYIAKKLCPSHCARW